MEKEECVVMTYTSPNEYSCTVMSVEEAEEKFGKFEINIREGIWSWREWKNIPIGRARNIYGRNSIKVKWGIIGVYNKKSIEHLDRMVHDAVEFHKPEPGPYDD